MQFKTADQARKATEFNGQVVGSNLKLVAKISNPGKRQDRTGALYEGREIYVRNLDHAVTERDLKAVFSKYGEVEKIRIPTNMSGRSKGFAFIAFSIKVSSSDTSIARDPMANHVAGRGKCSA